VNELSNTIDLESTLVRAEALFRRFQRTVEAIDKKSNFPAPKLRHRMQNASIGGVQSLGSATSASDTVPTANTSSIDAVSVGGTNSGNSGVGATAIPESPGAANIDKGKGKDTEAEMEDKRPKVISPELRALLSRKVEMLPRKVVKKTGEGRNSLGKA
jgi:hypothetical protein